MNIFVTDPDPVVSAEVLPDKHIVKMTLETCQMLAVSIQSGISTGVTIYYPRKMEHHIIQRRVHSEDILVLSGQQKVLQTLRG